MFWELNRPQYILTGIIGKVGPENGERAPWSLLSTYPSRAAQESKFTYYVSKFTVEST